MRSRRGCEVGRGLERPASCLGAWSKEFLRWIKEFWATRPHAYSHSRHARYPGVSGSSQSETFRPMLTFMGTVLDEADGVAGRTCVLRALPIGCPQAPGSGASCKGRENRPGCHGYHGYHGYQRYFDYKSYRPYVAYRLQTFCTHWLQSHRMILRPK